jgi:hypothetical protein
VRWGWSSLWVSNGSVGVGDWQPWSASRPVLWSSPGSLVLLGQSETELLVAWDANTTMRAERYGGVHVTMNGVRVYIWVLIALG